MPVDPVGAISLDDEAAPPRRAKRHVEMLVLAAIAAGGALALEVRDDERVGLRIWPYTSMPQSCASRSVFGVECPGCGLTRSFVRIAHADWRGAWEYHRLGWLMALATLLQFPYRLHLIFARGKTLVPPRLALAFGYALVALLIVNWLAGFILGDSP
jgi:hypothetical protein